MKVHWSCLKILFALIKTQVGSYLPLALWSRSSIVSDFSVTMEMSARLGVIPLRGNLTVLRTLQISRFFATFFCSFTSVSSTAFCLSTPLCILPSSKNIRNFFEHYLFSGSLVFTSRSSIRFSPFIWICFFLSFLLHGFMIFYTVFGDIPAELSVHNFFFFVKMCFMCSLFYRWVLDFSN